jgi:hypothetical protein
VRGEELVEYNELTKKEPLEDFSSSERPRIQSEAIANEESLAASCGRFDAVRAGALFA